MIIFFFKQKTAYELRISDWSSDVCSSDLGSATHVLHLPAVLQNHARRAAGQRSRLRCASRPASFRTHKNRDHRFPPQDRKSVVSGKRVSGRVKTGGRRIIKKKTKIQRSHELN